MKHLEKISKYESYKLWIFSKIEYLIKNNKLSAKKFSLISNKFIKQCKRYIESYREKNFCYEHGNKNKISKKAICENIKKEIVDLYINIQEKINSSSDNTNYRMPHKLFYNQYIKATLI